jgi:hypothetical protein
MTPESLAPQGFRGFLFFLFQGPVYQRSTKVIFQAKKRRFSRISSCFSHVF